MDETLVHCSLTHFKGVHEVINVTQMGGGSDIQVNIIYNN